MNDSENASPTPADLQRLREDWPAVTGVPGTTQGRYGMAGNLELVAPAVDDGLWVGWFNADPIETHQGAAVGRWSGGLRFGRGRRYVSATITQVHAGPDFLEVYALSEGGDLHRLAWTPADGFVDHGPVARGVRSNSAVIETPDGDLLAAVLDGSGVHLIGATPGDDYPRLALVDRDRALGGDLLAGVSTDLVDVDAAWHGGHADDGGHLDIAVVTADATAQLVCPASQSVAMRVAGATTAALAVDGDLRALLVIGNGEARLHVVGPDGLAEDVGLGPAQAGAVASGSVYGRGPWQVVLRDGASLRHVSGAEVAPVVADGWCATDLVTLHRG